MAFIVCTVYIIVITGAFSQEHHCVTLAAAASLLLYLEYESL